MFPQATYTATFLGRLVDVDRVITLHQVGQRDVRDGRLRNAADDRLERIQGLRIEFAAGAPVNVRGLIDALRRTRHPQPDDDAVDALQQGSRSRVRRTRSGAPAGTAWAPSRRTLRGASSAADTARAKIGLSTAPPDGRDSGGVLGGAAAACASAPVAAFGPERGPTLYAPPRGRDVSTSSQPIGVNAPQSCGPRSVDPAIIPARARTHQEDALVGQVVADLTQPADVRVVGRWPRKPRSRASRRRYVIFRWSAMRCTSAVLTKGLVSAAAFRAARRARRVLRHIVEMLARQFDHAPNRLVNSASSLYL